MQQDVILYRLAIEEAKESFLKELKANVETTLPEIEGKIAANQKRIAEKQDAVSPNISEDDMPSMPTVDARKVLLTVPAGYDKTQCRIWVTKIETENKKLSYKNKLKNGAWVGNYSGRNTKNPGQFYVNQPETDAIYAVWRKDLANGKSEIIAKAKYGNDTMHPLPLPEEARLLYLENQRKTLLEQKEYLSIYQQNKIVSQEAFELRKELQQLERQKKKSSAPEVQTLDLRCCEPMDKLKKSKKSKKNLVKKCKIFANCLLRKMPSPR